MRFIFVTALLFALSIQTSVDAQVTKITNGTLEQKVNGVVGTVYTASGESLGVTWSWLIDTGNTAVTGDLTVTWAGGSSSTTNVYIPASSTSFPVNVNTLHMVPNPAPTSLACNMTLKLDGTPDLVQSADFTLDAGPVGGGEIEEEETIIP